MNKLLLALSLCLVFSLSMAENWSVGDTAYVEAENAGMVSWFSSKPLVFYAHVTIEQVGGNRSKVFVDEMCWQANGFPANGKIVCDDEKQGKFNPGRYKWVSNYELEKYPSRW